jgi:hypothetical protein
MKNQINVTSGRFSFLMVCSMLLLLVVFGQVSSSSTTYIYPISLLPFFSPNLAYADDMMPSSEDAPATADTTTDAPNDGDDTPATTDALTAEPIEGDSKDNDDADGNDNTDNPNKQDSNDALLATQVGNCGPMKERDIFTNACQPIENPRNTESTTSTPTLCPVSYSPFEKESTAFLAKSKGSTMLKLTLGYTTTQASLQTRGLQQGLEPQIQLVADTFMDFEGQNCVVTTDVDPKSKIETTTAKNQVSGRTHVTQKNPDGDTFSKNEFNKDGSLISSQLGSDLSDPNGANTEVTIGKNGKRDFTIASGESPNVKFTMDKSGKITLPDHPSEKLQIKKSNWKSTVTSTVTIPSLNGDSVTVKVFYDKKIPGYKSITATKSDNSPLVHVFMNPEGALSNPPPLVEKLTTTEPTDPTTVITPPEGNLLTGN